MLSWLEEPVCRLRLINCKTLGQTQPSSLDGLQAIKTGKPKFFLICPGRPEQSNIEPFCCRFGLIPGNFQIDGEWTVVVVLWAHE